MTSPFASLVMQAGGPTSVINQSVYGLIQGFIQSGLGPLYASHHGLEGLLQERIFNLLDNLEIWPQLSSMPGAALGSARIKPNQDHLKRIIRVLDVHNIHRLVFIGGNDSAEALELLDRACKSMDYPIQTLLIPKTIDNDLLHTDHCPGYASGAQLVAHLTLGEILDGQSLSGSVKINVCMGRHSGWLAAASAMASWGCQGIAHRIYMPELDFSLDRFTFDVETCLQTHGMVNVVVAEGIASQLQEIKPKEKDAFGNALLFKAMGLGEFLMATLEKNLNHKYPKLRLRADTWGYMQRCFPGCISQQDSLEAHALGIEAVEYLQSGLSGSMLGLHCSRQNGDYSYRIVSHKLDKVAQKTKMLPRHFLNSQGNYVSHSFIEYISPLLNPLPKYVFLEKNFVSRKLPEYIPHKYL